tara:strand:- start:1677 stop:2489 length:813 start_codon:yes stop_codon:yes gene_type:complete
LDSIKKNSKKKYEIILHINDGSDGTLEYVKSNNFKYTHSEKNIGLCSSINIASNVATNNFILYAHDDMYFCPDWDLYLTKELKNLDHNKFYLSGTMIEPNSGHIPYNCGDNIKNFNEKKLLENFKNLKFFDHQGSHFAPHLVEKNMWNKVGGFSEEFNPGDCSDPDFNMKLWKEGVRIFKGINNFRVYHFSSITIRKRHNIKQNKGDKTFLRKWGITHKFFKKHYLRSRTIYRGPLNEPKKNLVYYIEFLSCKIKFLYLLFFDKGKNQWN